ncbi:MAG TPA: FemAB family XrtA/PEP-CTERM system-associated protein, partial [Gemmatimonadaceae bacterium]|nr:FemAB family XrtA/PEP-CTERM system-associated protein [Gemmatimonadaceae bacterium]
THCHLYGWKQLIESLFGHDCPYLACRTAEGGICGVLPLVRVRSWLFGHSLVSMPFLNYGGPLGSDVAVRALGQEAARRAKLEGVRLLELRSRVELPLDLRVSHRKLTVLVDIPGSSAALWAGFSTKIRNKVRRAQKAGVSVRFGPEEMGPFFSVFARHMRDLGTPTQSERFFQGIQDAFPDSVVFGCAYHGGRVIAGGCGFRWGDEFEITWSSALREHTDVRANYLLQWAFMERAANEGCRTFNFGRSSPGGGTHEFKRQWGGRDEPLWWYQFPPEAESTPSPDQGAYRWGPRLWRLLPVGLATRLGPGIVRYIP